MKPPAEPAATSHSRCGSTLLAGVALVGAVFCVLDYSLYFRGLTSSDEMNYADVGSLPRAAG